MSKQDEIDEFNRQQSEPLKPAWLKHWPDPPTDEMNVITNHAHWPVAGWTAFTMPKAPNPQDYVCTGGSSSPKCMNPVSPDDPYKELCHECLEQHVLELEVNLLDALEQCIKYRRAVKP